MKQHQPVSIVVPTLNEAENIPLLLKRIDAAMNTTAAQYEVLIIDDHSSDDTVLVANSLSERFPVRVYLKDGKRGKAFSLLEGFDKARYPLTAMIDADLQYPPEELTAMYNLLIEKNADVVITERQEKKTSLVRKLISKVYNFIFARLLFGIKFDTQSGLKLFRSDVLEGVTMKPSPWTFDLEFLVRALENKRKIISHTIPFEERNAGVTKIKVVSSSIEMARASLNLRWRTSVPKLRRGYRANDRFLKQAFGAFVVTLLAIGMTAGLTARASASALPVTDTAKTFSQTTGNVWSSLKHFLGSDSGTAEHNQSSPTDNNSSTTTNSAQTSAATSSTAAAPAVNTTATSTDNPSAHNTHATTKPSTSAQSSKLGAATSTQQQANVYDSSYPNYKLSASTAQRWSHVAKVTIEAGLTCIGLAAAFIVYRASRMRYYYRSLRS